MKFGRWLMPVFVAGLPAFVAACGGGGGSVAGARRALQGDEFGLGAIEWEASVERTVPFQNEGEEPLTVTIAKVRPAPDAACGCGVEGSEVRPATVPAGGTGELVFTLRAPESMRVMGYMRDKMLVELESNDPAGPARTITLLFDMGTKPDGGSGDGS